MKTEWPADKVERRSVASLTPYARNARTHSAAQVDQIAASIREWGWTVPVLVDEDGGLIAGHGRVLAAQKLGIAEVPVMVAAGWTESQKRAYVIADNRLAENAEWDENLLRFELDFLNEDGFDLALTGFDDDQPTGPIDGKSGVREVDTSQLEPSFWISMRGPLKDQARVLDAIKTALGAPGEVTIEIGTPEL